MEELNEKLETFEDAFKVDSDADINRIRSVVLPLWKMPDIKETLKVLRGDMGTQKVNMADNDWAE